MEQSRVEETHATQSKISKDPVYHSKEVVPIKRRNDMPAYKYLKGKTLQAENLKIGHEIRCVQNCGKHVNRPEGKFSRTLIGFSTCMKEVTRRGSGFARIPEISYCTFVPLKDTLVGI